MSEIHANFIVNDSQARAEDVLFLVQHIQLQVKLAFGIELELEVRLL